MAKTVRDANLVSREAREKLKARKRPYFRTLDRGVHLGYWKGVHGGTWQVRRYLGEEKYAVETIGTADDRQDADGVAILSFYQAQEAARKRAQEAAEEKRLDDAGPDVTVAMAVEEYLAVREARVEGQGGTTGVKKDGRYRMNRHVLSDKEFSALSLRETTAEHLSRWRNSFGKGLAASTMIRTSSDLKAALNAAAMKYRSRLPAGFALEVKTGLRSESATAPVAREAQILPDADVRASPSIAAEVDAEMGWGGDLHRMIVMLASTGARFSQVARITVGDVQAAQHRIMVPVSRKGRGEKQVKRIAVRVGDDVLKMLKPAIAGRKGHEILLLRPRFEQTGMATWRLIGRSPWLNPSELSRPWKAIRIRAELAADVVPYTYRHSSIVRGLRQGLPVRLVAALHDTSSAMIEKHYSAYIVDAMDELAAKAVVPMISEAPVPIRPTGERTSA